MDFIRDRIEAAVRAKAHRAWLLLLRPFCSLPPSRNCGRKSKLSFSEWIVVPPAGSGRGVTVFGLPAWVVFIFLGWLFEALVNAHRDLTPILLPRSIPITAAFLKLPSSEGRVSLLMNASTCDRAYRRCRRVGQNCVANLVRIERRLGATTSEITWDQDSLPLGWAMIGGLEVKVHYLAKRFVDVGRILKKSGKFKLATGCPQQAHRKAQRTRSLHSHHCGHGRRGLEV